MVVYIKCNWIYVIELFFIVLAAQVQILYVRVVVVSFLQIYNQRVTWEDIYTLQYLVWEEVWGCDSIMGLPKAPICQFLTTIDIGTYRHKHIYVYIHKKSAECWSSLTTPTPPSTHTQTHTQTDNTQAMGYNHACILWRYNEETEQIKYFLWM